jgi:hypothetical protein
MLLVLAINEQAATVLYSMIADDEAARIASHRIASHRIASPHSKQAE